MSRNNTGNPIDSKAFPDFEDNVKNLDLAVNSDGDTFQDRMGKSRLTWAGIVRSGTGDPAIAVDAAARAEAAASSVEQNAEQIAQEASQRAVDNVVVAVDGAVDRAEGAADRAESAAESAFVSADVYPDVAAGLDAVADGEQFQVVEGDEIVRYRRDSAVIATEVARYPSYAGVRSVSQRVDESSAALSLAESNPNLFTLDQVSAVDSGWISTTAEIDQIAGVSCWRMGGNVSSWGPFPRSMINGGVFSAAVNIIAAEFGVAGNVRVEVRQYTTEQTTSEIAGTRQEQWVPEARFSPGFIQFSGVEIHPDCTYIRMWIGTQGSASAVVYFRDMLLASGGNPRFRMPPVARPDPDASGSLAVSNPNLFTPEQVAALDTGGMSNAVSENIGGIPYWKEVGSNLRTWGMFPRAWLGAAETVSASVNIAHAQLGTGDVRFVLQQYSSTNTEIPDTRVDNFYPVASFKPGTLSIKDVPIHPECVALRVGIGVNSSDSTIWYRDMLLAPGSNAQFRLPITGGQPVPSTSVREVWVSASGSDYGSGSKGSPFATLERAVDQLDGRGTIYVAHGEYGPQQITASKVRELKIVGSASSGFSRPLFRYGSRLTLTAVSGRSGIYSSSLSADPKWLWVDGIPDEQTAVPYTEQHCFLNGQAHRLGCTKIWYLDGASSLAEALDAIESSATPLCWRDSATNTIYFNLPAGSTGISTHVRAAMTETGLIAGAVDVWAPEGRIEIVGIDTRYGGVNTKHFRESELYDVGVTGPSGNAFDLGNWVKTEMCRAAGAGSGSGTWGDGFNVHNHAVWSFKDLYGHDNFDDGESTHQNCRSSGYGSIMEYNGGGGYCPANGAQEVLHNCLSRKNSLIRWKQGGFMTTGGPLPGDDGVLTSLEAYNCVSIGDRNGFYDGTLATAQTDQRIIATNCRVFDAEETAYACAEIRDCTQSGSATAKSAGTVVINSSVVTV